jgi:hypothetical protein
LLVYGTLSEGDRETFDFSSFFRPSITIEMKIEEKWVPLKGQSNIHEQ